MKTTIAVDGVEQPADVEMLPAAATPRPGFLRRLLRPVLEFVRTQPGAAAAIVVAAAQTAVTVVRLWRRPARKK